MSAKIETKTDPVRSNVTTVSIKSGTRRKKTRKQQKQQPKTVLGRKLWTLRQQIVASGTPLLNWDELDREIAEQKGEQERKTHETNVH